MGGLKFMHEQNVIHRDLKPANVMITTEGQVKLVDFGTAFDVSKLTKTIEQTLIGTPAFIAPEVIQRGKHTTSTDIWSLGVTVYKMITGKLPFVNYDAQQLLQDIGTGTVEVNYPSDFPFHARAFKPEHRPSAAELIGHDFIMNPSESEPLTSITLTEVPSAVSSVITASTADTFLVRNEDILRTDIAVAGGTV